MTDQIEQLRAKQSASIEEYQKAFAICSEKYEQVQADMQALNEALCVEVEKETSK